MREALRRKSQQSPDTRDAANRYVHRVNEYVADQFNHDRRNIRICVFDDIQRDSRGRVDYGRSNALAELPLNTGASSDVLSLLLQKCVDELREVELSTRLIPPNVTVSRGNGSWNVFQIQVTDPLTGDTSQPLLFASLPQATPQTIREAMREQIKAWWYRDKQLRVIYEVMIAEVERRGWDWSDFDKRRGKVRRAKAAIDNQWREVCRIGNPLWFMNLLTEAERAKFAQTSKETILRKLSSGAYRSKHFDRTRTKARTSATVADKASALRKPSKKSID
jgi:hypothetical protein